MNRYAPATELSQPISFKGNLNLVVVGCCLMIAIVSGVALFYLLFPKGLPPVRREIVFECAASSWTALCARGTIFIIGRTTRSSKVRSWRAAFEAIGVSLLLASVSVAVTKYIQVHRLEANRSMVLLGKTRGLDHLFLLLLLIVIAPCSEEVLFRGFFYNAFATKFGCFYAALISSLIFALLHGSAFQFAPIFAISLALTWFYQRTKSIFLNVVAHSVVNLSSLITVFGSLHILAQ